MERNYEMVLSDGKAEIDSKWRREDERNAKAINDVRCFERAGNINAVASMAWAAAPVYEKV